MKRIAQIEKSFKRDDIPPFSSGDTLKVHYKIKEGDKERIQVFQGTVIGRRGSGTGATVTVRKISSGIGVERVFPLCSPNIAKIEKIRAGKVRRSKLYYLRELTGKSARIKEQIMDAEEREALKRISEGHPAEAPEEIHETVTDKVEAAAAKAEAKAAEAPAEEAPAEESKAEETPAEDEGKKEE